MYNNIWNYPYPYHVNNPNYPYYAYPNHCWPYPPMYYPDYCHPIIYLKDYGPKPYVVDIEKATLQNNNYRLALWTGEYLQLTLMCINAGDDIGLEIHKDHDQFIRIEQGQGIVMMGDRKDRLDFQEKVYDNYAIFIPAGKWHNLINTGHTPLKLYSIYAPPEHPRGTVHKTKKDAQKTMDDITKHGNGY